MARVEVPIVVLNSTTGLPVNGAAAAIKLRSNGAAATWWTAETGGTSSTASVVSDAQGRVNAWVDRGAYNVTISGTGITTYTEPFDATPGGDSTIDGPWLNPAIIPAGLVFPYGGAAAPTGYLLCQGGEFARATYVSLDNAIGTTFGAYTNGAGAAGTTHLRVPDLRGRVILGAGTGTGLTARALAAIGGNESETLTTAQIPAHTHGIETRSATPGITDVSIASASGDANDGILNAFSGRSSVRGTVDSTAVNTGGGGSHNNMQPWMALNYIIKT